MLRRRRDDSTDWAALLRLTRDGKPLYEGEIRPGHLVDLPGGLCLEVLWIRKHATPARSS
jgi:hypothetical protein